VGELGALGGGGCGLGSFGCGLVAEGGALAVVGRACSGCPLRLAIGS
jgi:hypothetical protein